MKLFYSDRILLGFSIFILSCEEPNAPDSVWDENDQGGSTPIVSSVEPAQGAFAGIDTLTITGQYFSDNISENLVYFNGMLGNVVEATSTTIGVVPPNLVSDSVQISVAVQGAFVFGKYERANFTRLVNSLIHNYFAYVGTYLLICWQILILCYI